MGDGSLSRLHGYQDLQRLVGHLDYLPGSALTRISKNKLWTTRVLDVDWGMLESTCAAQSAARLESRPSSRGTGTVPIIMSDKGELPKKKATGNPVRLETEDMPPVTPRKRKAGRAADSEPSQHDVVRVATHAEPTPRGVQGRRSDLVPIQSTVLERQRQRHSQTLPAHRRVSVDMHRSRRSNMSNPGSRPLRTRRASVPPGPPRTMLQHAWHTVLNSDPLVDSDEECPDEHLRLDYNRRMQVITRLRGRPPTPEQECSQTIPT